MREAAFQRKVIEQIEEMFPGCWIERLDPVAHQGIPDILILFNDRWAMLEFKKESTARKRPNQGHYVERFNNMSFAAFIFPENKEEVLYALQSALGTSRSACVS